MSFRLSGSVQEKEEDEEPEPLDMGDMEDCMVKDPIADGIADKAAAEKAKRLAERARKQ